MVGKACPTPLPNLIWGVVERAHHDGWRLVSALLTYGVRRRTLYCDERCGRRLLSQWNQLAHRTLPYSRSARVAMRAYNHCTARCRSGVASEDTLSFEEGDCFESWVYGGIFRSQLQWKSFLRFEGEMQIVGGVLELAADWRLGRRRAGFPHNRALPRLD